MQQAAAFAPPPTGIVTIEGLKRETIAYWKTIRIAWLSGYKINWVIPDVRGQSSSRSVWNLDVRVRPVDDIIPARTARYSVEPYVLVGGRPYIEPTVGTRVTVNFTMTPRTARGQRAGHRSAHRARETARWLPTPASYVTRAVEPVRHRSSSPDASIKWQGSEENLPVILDEFTYAKHGEWVTTTAMSILASNYFRLKAGLSTSISRVNPSPGDPVLRGSHRAQQVLGLTARAVEPDGPTLTKTNLDLRLMPDGNLHPYTWGWQERCRWSVTTTR